MTKSLKVTVAAWAAASLLGIGLVLPGAVRAEEAPIDSIEAQSQKDVPSDWVPVQFKLPKPAFIGTPKQAPAGLKIYKAAGNRQRDTVSPFRAPKGVENLALGKKVTSSDKDPIIGKVDLITDGDKEAQDGSWVELAPGLQWVQIDLGQTCEIYGILVWHHHADPRVYKDVVIQVADDADFITNVQTVFNNDDDNSSGLGLGKHYGYFEQFNGWLVPTNAVKGRYVRLYSNGSTSDDQNHYTEVEVWGLKK